MENKNMIKKFTQFNESLLQHLEGPTKEDVWDAIQKMEPQDMLYSSIEARIIDGVELAIKNGANLGHNMGAAIRFAASSGDSDIFSILLQHGMRFYIDFSNYRILLNAVEGGNLDIVKTVIKLSGLVGIRTHFKQMLRIAKNNNFDDIVDYLYYIQKTDGLGR